MNWALRDKQKFPRQREEQLEQRQGGVKVYDELRNSHQSNGSEMYRYRGKGCVRPERLKGQLAPVYKND